MTEVHRYKVVQMVSEAGGWIGYDPLGPEVVMASAYDQLKAENERFDEGMRSIASSLGAGGYNAEHLSATELVGKVRWGVDHLCDTHERRITELKAKIEALRKALSECIQSLSEEMLSKYHQAPEDMHPSNKRRYDLEMEELAGYRAAMAKEAGQ